MKKFNLIYTSALRNGAEQTEEIDYTGFKAKKLLPGYGSWFADWCEQHGYDAPNFTEDECGRTLLEFYNDTISPREPRELLERTFIRTEVLED